MLGTKVPDVHRGDGNTTTSSDSTPVATATTAATGTQQEDEGMSEVRTKLENTLDLLKMTAELMSHMDNAANKIEKSLRKGADPKVGRWLGWERWSVLACSG